MSSLNLPVAPAKRIRKSTSGATLSPAAANAAAASFAALTSKLDYLPTTDVEKVRQAYKFADEAHLGQIRASGEPYITHPIAVAAQCAEWKLDAQALMAALLHDALEDCGVTKIELIERFGSPVAELVDGLTCSTRWSCRGPTCSGCTPATRSPPRWQPDGRTGWTAWCWPATRTA